MPGCVILTHQDNWTLVSLMFKDLPFNTTEGRKVGGFG